MYADNNTLIANCQYILPLSALCSVQVSMIGDSFGKKIKFAPSSLCQGRQSRLLYP